MAFIKNNEGNIKLEIQFHKTGMYDYKSNRNDFENWIPFSLNVSSPIRNYTIAENVGGTMTVYEIYNLIKGMNDIIEHMDTHEKFTYKFCSSECFFELNFECMHEDDAIEIELWINIGNQTNGRLFGYDEGIRFIVGRSDIFQLKQGIQQENSHIIS